MLMQDVLQAFCSDHGLPTPTPDAEGVQALVLNGVTTNFIPAPAGDGFIVQACVGHADADDVDTLEALMAENLSAHAASGVLGADEEGFIFLTWRCADGAPAHVEFLSGLGRFADRASQWQNRLPAAAPQEATA